MKNALLLSNPAAFRDQWHQPQETSARVEALLAAVGIASVTTEDPDQIPVDTEQHQLLVLDIGTTAGDDTVIIERAERFVTNGGALLALHATSVGLGQTDGGRRLIGGGWQRNITWHPDEGDGIVEYTSPTTGDTHWFPVWDELYTDLVQSGPVRNIAWHTLGDVRQPLAWTLEPSPGRGRTAYSALGHSPRSYDSPGHVALLGDVIDWLLER
jgi:hypothetical protein